MRADPTRQAGSSSALSARAIGHAADRSGRSPRCRSARRREHRGTPSLSTSIRQRDAARIDDRIDVTRPSAPKRMNRRASTIVAGPCSAPSRSLAERLQRLLMDAAESAVRHEDDKVAVFPLFRDRRDDVVDRRRRLWRAVLRLCRSATSCCADSRSSSGRFVRNTGAMMTSSAGPNARAKSC